MVGQTGIYNVLKRNGLNKKVDRELYVKEKNITLPPLKKKNWTID